MMASITPEIDGQRPNTGAARSLTSDNKDATFTPKLISSPAKRNQAHSSGYGQVVPKVPKREPAPPPEEESPELTFKPDLSITKKTRKAVASTGYGKITVTPERRAAAGSGDPEFKPDMTVTAKARKNATSTGYGKQSVQPKKIDEKAFRPSFRPKMDFSKKGEIMRKQAASRLLEGRPQTAPARQDAERPPLLHTLAADRSEPKPGKDINGPGFILDGMSLSATPAQLSKSLVDLTPPPVKFSKHSQQIKEQATPTGYGSTWAPEVTHIERKSTEPVLRFGKEADTYIADPAELPVVKNTSTGRAVTNYPIDSYTPPVAKIERPQTADGPRSYMPSATDALPGIEDIPVVRNNLEHVASSGYGIVSPSSYSSVPTADTKETTEVTPEKTRGTPATAETPDEQTTIL